MNLLLGSDNYVAKWVQHRIPYVRNGWTKFTAIGLTDNDHKLVCGVVYHDLDAAINIQMSIAADTPKWASKQSLKWFFQYPFEQLDLLRVTALTSSSNLNTQAMLERLGFKQEGVIRKGYGIDDALVYGLLREECKWL
jgi:RimJ/RimL family protein N-acetyltransferase